MRNMMHHHWGWEFFILLCYFCPNVSGWLLPQPQQSKILSTFSIRESQKDSAPTTSKIENIRSNFLKEAKKLRAEAEALQITNMSVPSKDKDQFAADDRKVVVVENILLNEASGKVDVRGASLKEPVLIDRGLEDAARKLFLEKLVGEISAAEERTTSKLISLPLVSVQSNSSSVPESSLHFNGTVPILEEVYSSINPWWIGWLFRNVMKENLVGSIPPGVDKELYEIAYAVEVKGIVEMIAAVDDTEFDFQQLIASLDSAETRVVSRALAYQLRNQKDDCDSVAKLLNGESPRQISTLNALQVDQSQNSEVAGGKLVDVSVIKIMDEANGLLEKIKSLKLKLMSEKLAREQLIQQRMNLPNENTTDIRNWIPFRKPSVTQSSLKPEDPSSLLENEAELLLLISEIETFCSSVLEINTTNILNTNMKNEAIDDLSKLLPPEESLLVTYEIPQELYDSYQRSLENSEFNGKIFIESPKLNSSAEWTIQEYFDSDSMITGQVVSREGAKLFQAEVLKDLFKVTGVAYSQGAVIFDGQYLAKSSKEFADKLQVQLQESSLKDQLGYFIVKNEKFPDLDMDITKAVMDSLIGMGPAVIIYPLSWDSNVQTIQRDPKKLWRNLLNILSVAGSFSFAIGSFNLLGDASTLEDGASLGISVPYLSASILLKDNLIPLVFLPIIIQQLATLIEGVVGSTRGIKVSSILVPSFTLFHFGSRTTYLTKPKNRDDLFDIAAIGTFASLFMSGLAMYRGLEISAEASQELKSSFPTIPLSLLKINAVVAQSISSYFPGIFQTLDINAAATVHLHWLALVGALSFLVNTLQLIPIDNSSGGKLVLAVLGEQNSKLISILMNFLRLVVLIFTSLSFVTGEQASELLDTNRIVLDYIIASQFAGSSSETQLPVDGLSGVSEGRKIMFAGLVSILLLTFVPYGDIITASNSLLDTAVDYLSSLSQATR